MPVRIELWAGNVNGTVVEAFVGHGIGASLHESPEVPNYVQRGVTSPRIREGMVLAIEPMVNEGDWPVRILEDGWTAGTRDSSLSAHFEHSVAITENGPEDLTINIPVAADEIESLMND